MNFCLIEPRDLNSWERATINALLSQDFPGVEELRLQVDHLKVSEIYPGRDPTVTFSISDEAVPASQVDDRVPVEAEGRDIDGMLIMILLHVVDGFIWQLEVLRGTDYEVIQLPEPSSLTFFAPRPYFPPGPSFP